VGTRTEAGLRQNVNMAALLEAWLRGQGACFT
jgi:hypothetical protein